MTKYDPLWEQSGSYNAREDRLLITHLWDEGVMDLTAFVVTQRALGANFTVDISAGTAVVTGDIDADQGNYLCRETAATTGTTVSSVPSAGNSRIDLVVLEVRDNTEDGGGSNDWRFRVVAGEPTTGTPSAPALPSHAIALATIGPITNSTTSITNSLITDARTLAGRRCTPGTIEHLAAAYVPNGWLACDGSAVSRTTYARLYAHIGTSFGVGNGTTTFNLPDLRGKVAVPVKSGQAQVDTIGETGGEYTHTLTSAELPPHQHTFSGTTGDDSPDHQHGVDPPETQLKSNGVDQTRSGPTLLQGTVDSPYYGLGPVGGDELTVDIASFLSGGVSVRHQHTFSGNTGNGPGSSTAHNVMQPYQVVGLAVIRT